MHETFSLACSVYSATNGTQAAPAQSTDLLLSSITTHKPLRYFLVRVDQAYCGKDGFKTENLPVFQPGHPSRPGIRAEVRRSFITTNVRDESQVTPQGRHRSCGQHKKIQNVILLIIIISSIKNSRAEVRSKWKAASRHHQW